VQRGQERAGGQKIESVHFLTAKSTSARHLALCTDRLHHLTAKDAKSAKERGNLVNGNVPLIRDGIERMVNGL
jgi:hypothetical protein